MPRRTQTRNVHGTSEDDIRGGVLYDEDCTGRPQKKAGDEAIISRVSIAELDHIRESLSDGGRSGGGSTGTGSWLGEAALGGGKHRVLALSSPSNALLVLADPQPLPDPFA